MTKTDQNQVLEWIKQHIFNTELYLKIDKDRNPKNNTGADLILNDQNKAVYFIEAIAFSIDKKGHGTGKNQSDFWKAYSQACSRIQRNGKNGSIRISQKESDAVENYSLAMTS